MSNGKTRANSITLFLLALLLVLTPALHSFAQTNSKTVFPGKMRGYKIYKAKVLVQAAKDETPADVSRNFDSLVKIAAPQNFQLGMNGATFELPLSMNIYKIGCQVDSIAFEDMKVNGIKMQVDEFAETFAVNKGVEANLPRPLKVKVSLAQDPASLMKFDLSLTEFEVAGRVYVFGTFKKFGMKFKRYIPVEFKFKTKFSIPFAGSN